MKIPKCRKQGGLRKSFLEYLSWKDESCNYLMDGRPAITLVRKSMVQEDNISR